MGLSRNHRNRRKKRAVSSSGRRLLLRGCWVLAIGLGSLALLRFESSLPESISMGLHLDPVALAEFRLPEPGRRSEPEPAPSTPRPPQASAASAAPLPEVPQPRPSRSDRASARAASAATPSTGWSWLRHPRLRVDRVLFFGLSRLDADLVTRELGLSNEVALIDVTPASLCDRLLTLGRFSRCAALRLPPSTVALAVRERDPIAVVEETGQGISRDGARFELLGDEGRALPRIAGDVARALPYVDAARWAAVPILRIEARATERSLPSLTAWPQGPQRRVLLGADPIQTFLRYRALSQARVLDEAGLEIDLRFRGNVFLRKMAESADGNEGRAA